MPNIKSAKKRVLVAEVRRQKNAADKSAMKTAVKKFETAAVAGNKEEAGVLLKQALRTLDKTASKGVIHKNTAARQKSRLTKRANQI
ncbi:30S ribosomal protein S20 [bioreactor metagenome]|uniref:30S ribosomal protein S20 n=1 Tax=bioreactor metagenome TaxID=1076179 RepID=A0A645J7C3_9ZZZZ